VILGPTRHGPARSSAFTDWGFDWAADSPDTPSKPGAVRVVPKAGGPVRTIAGVPTTGDRSELDRIMPLAIDERFVYFGARAFFEEMPTRVSQRHLPGWS
jgi:hypothetical protein